MSTIEISYSELDSYRQCRLKHQLAYKERWEAGETAPALARGSAFHAVMQAHYEALKTGGGMPAALNAAKSVLGDSGEHRELLTWLYDGYTEQYAWDPIWEVLEVEQRLSAWLPSVRGGRSNVRLKGFVDLLVRDRKRDELWIVDHKTCKNLPKGRELDIDDQMGLYIYLARAQGLPVVGCIYNACRTEKLKRPMAPDERFARYRTLRSEKELVILAQEARTLAQEAYARRLGDAPRSPNPDTCRWRCSFLEPCLHGRKGGNMRSMLEETGYKQGTGKRR